LSAEISHGLQKHWHRCNPVGAVLAADIGIVVGKNMTVTACEQLYMYFVSACFFVLYVFVVCRQLLTKGIVEF
jgi:hypothetical protein